MSFNIGLSGIRSASTDLEVTGNNVANASTTGFKQSRAEFGDVYTNTLLGSGSKPVGSGVMVENIRQQFSQGNISGTGNALDMAIDGNGFFIIEDRGVVSYTRAGLFGLDKEGYVVANNGGRVQGFDANSQGVVSGVLDDLQIQSGNQAPALTSRVAARLNLNAGEKVLQEQGLELTSNGYAVGIADSGIIESTTTSLIAANRPQTAGGAPLFTAADPTADFRTIPGTSTTTRSTPAAFPLTISAGNNDALNVVVSGAGTAITVAPGTYNSVEDLAEAIRNAPLTGPPLGTSPGFPAGVTLAAVGGQLVFTNTVTGSAENVTFTGIAAVGANAWLGSPITVLGRDAENRANSFNINLVVPAPDSENRSGTASISLDEEYKSVQQLATSINRQLNSQSGGAYIGVRAQATEITPSLVPPQFKLELVAVEEGEASEIEVIIDPLATNPAILADLQAILQLDETLPPPTEPTLTKGIEGVNNQYPAQQVTLTDPDGNETVVSIPEATEANEIASIFNRQPGVTATANTVMTIPVANYNNVSNSMKLTVSGQALTATTLPEIAEEINSFRSTTLPGFNASINDSGDLVITNEIGRDVKLQINSTSNTDSLAVLGAENTGPVVLTGASATDSVAVGGTINFTINDGYSITNPQPALSGIFGALTEDEFTPVTLNAFDPLDQNTYNHATPTKIFDSLGNEHVMTQFFVKEPLDPNLPNEENIWAMYVLVDGQEVGDPDSTLDFPENLAPTRARHELFFNQDGTLDTEATADIYVTNWNPTDSNGDPTGAFSSVNVLEGGLPLTNPPTNSNFQISLAGSTQFGTPFAVSEGQQDGYATGRLAGLEVDQEGMIFARYTNGQAQVLGQVGLANFQNPEGLTPLGSTGWGESFESGVAAIGSPRSGAFGQVKSASLEDSNVDISEELVGLIIAQRNFQASAKTIETMDQVTQTILNL